MGTPTITEQMPPTPTITIGRVRSALTKQMQAAQEKEEKMKALMGKISQSTTETIQELLALNAALQKENSELRAQLAKKDRLHAEEKAEWMRSRGATVHRDIEAMFTEVEEKVEAVVCKYAQYRGEHAQDYFTSPELFVPLEEKVLPRVQALRSAPCLLDSGALSDIGAVKRALAPDFKEMRDLVHATYGSVHWEGLASVNGSLLPKGMQWSYEYRISIKQASLNQKMHEVEALVRELTDTLTRFAT